MPNRPRTGSASMGGFPLLAARILMEGSFGLEHRTDEASTSPALLAVGDRFEVRADDRRHLELEPAQRPTTIEVETSAGRVSVACTPSEAARMSPDQVVRKFMSNAEPVIGEDAARALCDALLSIEDLADVTALTDLLAPPEDQPSAAHME